MRPDIEKGNIMNKDYYTYTNESGQKITVWIQDDIGMVNGKDKPWHKVICRAIGFNNSIPMILDFNSLIKE